jgi:predicted metal-dependent enzyme (double-stranded beta helix superfamily)
VIEGIRGFMVTGPSLENHTRSKAHLIALAARRDLFTFEYLPLPEDDAMECSYLIHEYEDGSYSLYINSGAPHQYYAPPDHGDAWAIIAGVQGRERHQLYLRRGAADTGDGPLIGRGEVIVEPGDAVTMQPDGIHEVNGVDAKPVLHHHL